ncbi:MAG: LysM peptidoglycan-binding domain-containing protein [Bacteroidales bacterium]|nr:LysM peptidoglycan-binding domain-containing protein [Bacteroidales bacterium]MDD4361499.1 LysM peptidoglycan-binding domain-containing protein [Bacteroidales bacterium]
MKLRSIIALFSCLIYFMLVAEAQENNIPIIKLFDKEYYKYEVQPSETLYSLSRRFNVSREEITAMNPFVVEGLKTGQILIIPLRTFKPGNEEALEKTQENSPDRSSEQTPEREQNQALMPIEDSLSAAASSASVLFEKWEYDYYTVEKWREYLSDIAQSFGVSVDELRLHNPNVPNRLARGSLLMIPVKKHKLVPERDDQDSEAAEEFGPKIFCKPSIALLLPFMLDDTTANSIERYVEFYEGMLLAADSLKQLNFSFDLSVFDAGNTVESLRRVLSSGWMDRANYVIAAVSHEQMMFLSDWSVREKKYLILPFSSRIPETEYNPYIYQINPPQSLNHRALLELDTSYYAGKNILFIHTKTESSDERRELFDTLKNNLKHYGIPYQELTDNEPAANIAYSFPDTIARHLSQDKENLLIPAPFPMTESNRVITMIGSAANIKSKARITLLGYPEWLALSKNNLPQLYRLNTHIYSNYYADFQNDKLKEFQKSYAYEFGKDLLNTFPRYALMGYDLMMYFVPKISGSDWEAEGLQHGFDFVQTKQGGGKYNRHLFIIQFTPQRKIISRALPR